MQISNTFVSMANYTASSVKSGFNSGASIACKTVRCAGRFFASSASAALNIVARNPKISITLGLLAGAAAIAAIAKKRFNTCVFEKLSSYNPFKGKKVEEKVEAQVAKEEAPGEIDAPVEKPAEEAVKPSDEDSATEVEDSPATSQASTRASSPAISARRA